MHVSEGLVNLEQKICRRGKAKIEKRAKFKAAWVDQIGKTENLFTNAVELHTVL